MTRLHPDDIRAIAAEVARQIRLNESVNTDLDYLVTLPPEERKKRLKAEFIRKTRKDREVSQ